jgi:hypothetical protein
MISGKTISDIFSKKYPQLILIVLLLLSSGCKSFKWKPVLHTAERIPYIFDEANFIGTGLKYTGSGYLPKTCLAHVNRETRGGELTFEFHHINKDYKGDDRKTGFFVRESLKRSGEFNIQKKKPVSFLIIVKLNNRHSVISEERAEFLPFVNDIIKKGDMNSFFEACGTEYVYSIRFNSRIKLFVTYYISPGKEEEKLKEIIRKRITDVPDNSLQAGIFRDLSFSEDTYFSLNVGTDYFFNPVEFPFKKRHGEGVSGFLNRAIHSILNAGKGELTGYETMPWKQFGPLKKFGVDKSFIKLSESSDESIFKSLNALETSLRNFNIKYYQVRRAAEKVANRKERIYVYDCLNEMIEARNWVNWNQYYSCYNKASEERSISLSEIPRCNVIIDFARMIESSNACKNIPVSAGKDMPLLWKEINRPVQLTQFLVADPETLDREYTGYRDSDEEQVEDLPEQVMPGQQMDMNGKVYPGKCIDVKSVKPVKTEHSRDFRITGNYYPHEVVRWPLWKKIFLFWKKPEPDRVRFRGFMEIEGYSRKLSAGFKLTKEAEKLARENLNRFYARCGTHYVSQVKHRRGFVYYFSFNKNDDDIEIKPYGLPEKTKTGAMPEMGSMKEKLTQMPAGSKQGGGCFSGLIPSFSGGGEDLLEPKTVKIFFKNKERLIELFRSDEKAVPVRLFLEPWSEYFQVHRILSPEQLDLLYYKTGAKHEVITYIEKNGNVYTGEVKGKHAEGEGTMVYPDKTRYSGVFKKGKREGMGTQRWPNGDLFTGKWKNDRRNGFGIYRWRNGDLYEGLFTDDNRNGRGTLYWENGDVYRGEWKNNKRDGEGVYIWSDGDRYEGKFKEDRLTGEGKFIKRGEDGR